MEPRGRNFHDYLNQLTLLFFNINFLTFSLFKNRKKEKKNHLFNPIYRHMRTPKKAKMTRIFRESKEPLYFRKIPKNPNRIIPTYRLGGCN